ncbi:MAG: DUF177 domain-containing protein [Rhodospirillales bacterium]|nr:DUF177 domain-containing protein [Rhodospirillales bacterium]MCB9995514.1 DUF177 domain-containing protein [Rhodospirillales bacterium]
MTSETLNPEWSHKVDADDIGKTPIRTTISASPQERKDLARRLGVDSVEFLEARLVMERVSGNRVIHIEGNFAVRLTQSCVVTLEPIVQEIEGPVEGWYANADSAVSLVRARHEKKSRSNDAEIEMLDEKDDPEPLVDGQIDLGELVTQYVSLSVDPYPHQEGVTYEELEKAKGKAAENPVRQNPFAALKDWKVGKNKEN